MKEEKIDINNYFILFKNDYILLFLGFVLKYI